MQFDADTVGASSPAADAEMCMMMADAMEAVGIERGDYVIKVNSRKLLEGLREALAAQGAISDAQWLGVLRAIDKLDRLGRTASSSSWPRAARMRAAISPRAPASRQAQADKVMRFLGFSGDAAEGTTTYKPDTALSQLPRKLRA